MSVCDSLSPSLSQGAESSTQVDGVDVNDEFDAAIGREGRAEFSPEDSDGVQVGSGQQEVEAEVGLQLCDGAGGRAEDFDVEVSLLNDVADDV